MLGSGIIIPVMWQKWHSAEAALPPVGATVPIKLQLPIVALKSKRKTMKAIGVDFALPNANCSSARPRIVYLLYSATRAYSPWVSKGVT